MRLSLTLLAGAFLGVVVLLSLQQALSSVCGNPVVRLIPGIDQVCTGPSPASASAPPPTPVPSPTPRIIQVDMEKARMVHKTIYSEMGITVHIAGKEPTIRAPITGTVITEKEVLLITSSSCTAGIDHDEKPPIVEATGTQASVKIADPKLFGCGVTAPPTYFDGKGILPAPAELYNRLADQAAQETRTRAQESDLLVKAKDNARAEIELYLRRLGFEQVLVEVAANR